MIYSRRSKINLHTITTFTSAFATVLTMTCSQAYGSEFQNSPQRNIKNWGLFNNSNSNADIHAIPAWSIQEGKREIIVAVIDTGIDPNQASLSKNIWHDPLDKNQSNFGFNFVDPGKNPIDLHGHGTHVSGIIDGELDPRSGTSGVAHHVSIMPIKYYSDSNSGLTNLNNTIEGINYAVDHGARIINYSGGGPEFSEREYLAIKRAESKGILFVAAAGNESENIDNKKNYYFPASYSNSSVSIYATSNFKRPSNILVVAATNTDNQLISASNWGKESVDVAAPGENILSTLPNGKIGTMSGTSQATAFVSGVAALLLSENRDLTPQQIKEIIINTSDKMPKLENKVVASGRINVYEALKMARKLRQGNESPKNLASLKNPS